MNRIYSGGTFVRDGTLIVETASSFPDGSSLTIGADASSLFRRAGSPAEPAAVPELGTLALLLAAIWSAIACYRFSRRSIPADHIGSLHRVAVEPKAGYVTFR
jgi:hypothetical protein